ncbi:hypothetical protein BH24ACT7_BH24ACT7_10480 [soil metagenome]
MGRPWGEHATPYEAIGGDAVVRERLRCMGEALDEMAVVGSLRRFLDERFAPSADHLRNR